MSQRQVGRSQGREIWQLLSDHARSPAPMNAWLRGWGEQVANTLWSYATLGHDPGPALLDAVAAHISARMHVFRPQASSNSLWVRRPPPLPPPPPLVFRTSIASPPLSLAPRPIAHAAERGFPAAGCECPAWSTCATAGTWQHSPLPLDAMRCGGGRGQAYAKLKYNPGRELLEAATRRALAALHQYTPQEIGNTL